MKHDIIEGEMTRDSTTIGTTSDRRYLALTRRRREEMGIVGDDLWPARA